MQYMTDFSTASKKLNFNNVAASRKDATLRKVSINQSFVTIERKESTEPD